MSYAEEKLNQTIGAAASHAAVTSSGFQPHRLLLSFSFLLSTRTRHLFSLLPWAREPARETNKPQHYLQRRKSCRYGWSHTDRLKKGPLPKNRYKHKCCPDHFPIPSSWTSWMILYSTVEPIIIHPSGLTYCIRVPFWVWFLSMVTSLWLVDI